MNDKHLLGVLIILFLVFRFLFLFSSLDKIYESEELYRGTITREIIQGPLIPLREYLDYKVEYFPGGVLTVGILAVPFFLLFGQTYIALKLVGLSFALGTFILWYLFLDRFFDRKTAIISSLLFIFCMPFYTQTSLITWGTHPEANFFTILSIFIFSVIFFREKIPTELPYLYRKNEMLFFLLGLVSGFGLWFVMTYLLTLIYLFLFWFVFDKRFFLRKAFYIFCFGFVTGFSPAIYYFLFYKIDIFGICGKGPLNSIIFCDLNNFLPKMFKLLSWDIPNSFLFPDVFNINGKILDYLYYFIFIIAFLYLLFSNRRGLLALIKNLVYPVTLKEVKVEPSSISKKSLILTYPILFFLSYSLSDYSISPRLLWRNVEICLDSYIAYRYIIPLIPFILVIMGIFIGEIRRKKIAFNMFLFSALTLGITGNLNLSSFKNFGKFFNDKGYSYSIVAEKIGLRVTDNLERYIKPFDKLEENSRAQFYEGLGAGIAWRLRDAKISSVIEVFEKEIKPRYRPYLYKGWGTLFYFEYPEEFEEAIATANNIPVEYQPFFYEGLGRRKDYFYDMKKLVNVINRIEKIYQPYCYMGAGYSIGFDFKFDRARQSQLLSFIDKEYQKFVLEGIRLGMKDR